MKNTAAIAWLALAASLLLSAASPGASPQASLKASTNEQLLERIEAEVAFARGLATLTSARAAEWSPLIARADDIVRTMKAAGMRGDAAGGGREGGMNWMWPWPATVAVTNDTFRTCTPSRRSA